MAGKADKAAQTAARIGSFAGEAARARVLGAPVVLLHGRSATPAEWAPHVAALGGDRPVPAVDRAGEPGYSTQTTPIRTADHIADWLEEVLAGLTTGMAVPATTSPTGLRAPHAPPHQEAAAGAYGTRPVRGSGTPGSAIRPGPRRSVPSERGSVPSGHDRSSAMY
ncbi:alpha/beta fold hydrolase [Streptomyces roseoverticillatus]|uniref:alpha/beta fold hydrolase n=1 Tax=Streptomyces roseoverticillatus TaxID=66429 RepID=UPI0004C00991|nr:hypothetical protein [Streptomyces roseoverticillatus]